MFRLFWVNNAYLLEFLCRIAQLIARLTHRMDSRARNPFFDNRSGHILSFLLPLIQEVQLSVTGDSMFTKHWVQACPEKMLLG